MTGREPNPIDVHVGRRVRFMRLARGLSQGHVADKLGITFQQVQKYERGVNRVSASKLWALAEILDTPISSFFDGLDQASEDSRSLDEDFAVALTDPACVEAVKALSSIPESEVRLAIANSLNLLTTARNQDG